jgi:alkylhydroperoxidase/carboxymuconolactone decarboxylase family protein YurZ
VIALLVAVSVLLPLIHIGLNLIRQALDDMRWYLAVHLKAAALRLPARQTILNAIGNLLAYGCQLEKLLFAENIFAFFGKSPIHRRLVPKVVIPIHVCHCA